jgi:chromosome segregation ATPase
MDVKANRKIEEVLYEYYRKKKRIDSLKSKLIRIDNRIERLRKDIKECNVELDNPLKAIDYSREYVKSNSIVSSIERELDMAVDRIMRELELNLKEKYKVKGKIMNLEKQIENTETLLQKLNEEELRIIELRYNKELSYRQMEEELFMARSTLQRRKDKIIRSLVYETNKVGKYGG